MEKTLRLSSERGFFVEKEPFNLAENNPLGIKLEFATPPTGEIFASWQFDGEPRRTVKVEDLLTVESSELRPGNLCLTIVERVNGRTVRRYICEALVLSQISDGILAVPEIEHLKTRYENMAADFEKRIKATEDALVETLQILKGETIV